MTVRKAIQLTLILPLILLGLIFFINFKSDQNSFDLENIVFAFFAVLFFWVIGLFIGLLFSVIIKSPSKESYFYLSGQCLIILAFLSYLVYDSHEKKLHDEDFGNMEYNHSFLLLGHENDSIPYPTPEYVVSGFNLLENQFKNKNDFKLKAYYSSFADSLFNGHVDTLYNVYFEYLDKSNIKYFSKIGVFKGKATLNILDGNVLTDKKYIMIKNAYKDELASRIESIKKSINELPDSTRKKLLKVFNDHL